MWETYLPPYEAAVKAGAAIVMTSFNDLGGIPAHMSEWLLADVLRGPYRPPQYERVMLPMIVLRRFDCVLEATKAKVVAEYDKRKGGKLPDDALDALLNQKAGKKFRFHNRYPQTLTEVIGDSDHAHSHLVSYINGFSANVRKIFEYFELDAEIQRMHESNILYLVLKKFCEVDLHPENLPNEEMGKLFEHLIRKFNEQANETARDVHDLRLWISIEIRGRVVSIVQRRIVAQDRTRRGVDRVARDDVRTAVQVDIADQGGCSDSRIRASSGA